MTEPQRRRGQGSTDEWRVSRDGPKMSFMPDGPGDPGYEDYMRARAEWNGDDGYVEGERAPFGYLLTLDLYRCTEVAIGSVEHVYTFLEALVEALHMHKQAPPYVLRSPPDYPGKAGVSAWIPLIESGISVHTLTQRNFVSVDVYCCHKFDVDTVLAVSKLFFKPHDIDMHEIKRGVRYHAD